MVTALDPLPLQVCWEGGSIEELDPAIKVYDHLDQVR